MTFGIQGNSFVRDGKPIKIISGAVHYFRNMPDTWRDIFLKMKAMGCNCVETYCAWNMHEKVPEEYARTVDDMLRRGSVNMYMFIGGTNFGFTAGANHTDRFLPDVTSYDYDALLTECGNITALPGRSTGRGHHRNHRRNQTQIKRNDP